MSSRIDGNCRHLHHIDFLRLHIQIQRTGMDREWVFTLPIFNKLVLNNISPYPTMFSTIDGNCCHFSHINFVCLHIQTTYRYGRRIGLHAPNFQQTCPRHSFNVNKISEYKHNE